ncbi:MAG: HPr family phosphocarrier protein [Anaerolineaceae bacterium]|nr:HPr family phosphocarrier protein [Anaerolineaceae bacterium]
MKSFEYTITDPVGLHARPAGVLVKEVKKYASTITITKGEKTVDARKLMAIMGMGVKQGDTVTVTVDGADEDTAFAAIEEFFKANF